MGQGRSVQRQGVDIDAKRYMGTWYEIGKYPFFWENRCSHAIADYSLQSDGSIHVVNTCYNSLGCKNKSRKYPGRKDLCVVSQMSGKATPTGYPGVYNLKFDRVPFTSKYIVLWVSEDYSYALVGSDRSEVFWILSRKPVMKSEVYTNQILPQIKRLGYNQEKIVFNDGSIVF